MKKFLSLALALIMVLAIVPVMIPTADAAAGGYVDYATFQPDIDGVLDACYGETYDLHRDDFHGNSLTYWFAYNKTHLFVFAELFFPDGYTFRDKTNGNYILFRMDTNNNNSPWNAEDLVARLALYSDGTVWGAKEDKLKNGIVSGNISEDGKTVRFEMQVPISELGTATGRINSGQKVMFGTHVACVNPTSGKFETVGKYNWVETGAKPTVDVMKSSSTIVPDGNITAAEWGAPSSIVEVDGCTVKFWFSYSDKGIWVAAQGDSKIVGGSGAAQSGLVWRTGTGTYKGAYIMRFNGYSNVPHQNPNMANSDIRGMAVSGDVLSLEILLTWANLGVANGNAPFDAIIEWTDQWNGNKDNYFIHPNGIITGNTIKNDGSNLNGAITFVPTNKTVKSIAVSKAPNKTVYYEHEDFDPTGMQITVTYSDNSTAVLSDGFTFTNRLDLQLGDQVIGINYGGQTTGYVVTVLKVPTGEDETDWEPSATGAPEAAPAPDAAPVETPAAGKPHGFGSYGPAGQPIPAPCDKAIRGPKAKF